MALPANEPAVAPLLRVRGYSHAALGVEKEMNETGFVSPFLTKPKLLESEIGFVIYDGFP